jgi:hypothetical protein
MRESDSSRLQAPTVTDRPRLAHQAGGARSPRSAGPSPAEALALQHAVGNHAAARVLGRWAKHPDEKEKGKLVADGTAADYLNFNFPLST